MTAPGRSPSNSIARFPLHRAASLLVREREGDGWLALAGPNGWSFGSLDEARHEAKWLARNLSLSVREVLR